MHPSPTSARPQRAAVIGCGAISKEHLDYLAASERVDLVGVCDLSAATAQWTASHYGTDAFTNHREMLSSTNPDVVHVLTPPRSHVPLSVEAIAAGAHVVVEKPAASNATELAELYDTAEQAGRMLMENQNYRFNDGIIEIEQMLAAGHLGTLTEVDVRIQQHLGETRFADPNVGNPLGHLAGGAIRDYLPHMVGLILHLAGDRDLRDVHALWRSDLGLEALGLDGLDATLTSGDVRGRVFFTSLSEPEGFMLTARGTLGSVTIDLWQPHAVAYRQRGPAALSPLINQASNGRRLVGSAVRGFRDKIMQHLPYHGIGRSLDAFYEAAQTGGKPPLDRHATLLTATAVDQISAFAEPS